jgi:hypothetical protein
MQCLQIAKHLLLGSHGMFLPCLRASFLLLAMLCPGIHWLMGLADIVLGRPAAHFYRFERFASDFFGRSSLAADS